MGRIGGEDPILSRRIESIDRGPPVQQKVTHQITLSLKNSRSSLQFLMDQSKGVKCELKYFEWFHYTSLIKCRQCRIYTELSVRKTFYGHILLFYFR